MLLFSVQNNGHLHEKLLYIMVLNLANPSETAAASLFALAFFVVVAATGAIISLMMVLDLQLAEAFLDENSASITERAARAPVVISGDNIYTAWWTNNTANNNEEAMFRDSNDAGGTFGNKINLSNTTDPDSWRVEIASKAKAKGRRRSNAH